MISVDLKELSSSSVYPLSVGLLVGPTSLVDLGKLFMKIGVNVHTSFNFIEIEHNEEDRNLVKRWSKQIGITVEGTLENVVYSPSKEVSIAIFNIPSVNDKMKLVLANPREVSNEQIASMKDFQEVLDSPQKISGVIAVKAEEWIKPDFIPREIKGEALIVFTEGTVIDSGFRNHLIQYLCENYQIRDPFDSSVMTEKNLLNDGKLCSRLDFEVEGSKEWLKEWISKAENRQIFYITSRPLTLHAVTEKFLMNNQFPITELFSRPEKEEEIQFKINTISRLMRDWKIVLTIGTKRADRIATEICEVPFVQIEEGVWNLSSKDL